MSKIHLLDQNLINKIAAGEVVERPSSVVKELVENSLDAQANRIVIEIENGGIDCIRIIDNGLGMSAEDAKLSVRRHATSKIRSEMDLMQLATLGFRGEALAAISAVSSFQLITKQQNDASAAQVTIDQGELTFKQSAGTVGTTVEVRGIFHAVPARLKFLKSASTEFRHIVDVVTRQALLHPEVAWKLSHNGKVLFDYPIVSDWKERVQLVLGREVSQDLLTVEHQRASLRIHGFVTHPGRAQKSKDHQFLFVNNRAVQDYLLAKAVRQACDHHIASHLHPGFVLQISIAPDLVDVNVHPRKSEVKFASPSGVFREVMFAVKKSLEHVAERPHQIALTNYETQFDGSTAATYQPAKKQLYRLDSKNPSGRSASPAQIRQQFDFQQKIATHSMNRSVIAKSPVPLSGGLHQLGDWKLIGQAHKSFLLVQSEEGIYIVDQHAAAEKILYEKLLQEKGQVKQQKLLVPEVVEFSPTQALLVQQHLKDLDALGLELVEFGANTFQLVAVPQDMPTKDLKEVLSDIIEDLKEYEGKSLPSVEDRQKAVAKMVSCRAAVKFNDVLSLEEQITLLSDIKRLNIVACCHGRPVMIKITRDDLAKTFHRP